MRRCERCGSTERYEKTGRCVPCSRARSQRWKAENRERHRAGSLRWQAENVEARRVTTRDWARRNRPAVAATKRRWREENPERHAAQEHARRARKQANGGNYTVAEWLALCEFYLHQCLCCRADDLPLTVDHVIPISKGGSNDIANIQPLCMTCNAKKGVTCTDYRIDWTTREELTEAIPPAYTEHIGHALLERLASEAAA